MYQLGPEDTEFSGSIIMLSVLLSLLYFQGSDLEGATLQLSCQTTTF